MNTPLWMRGPGFANASFAIESAMDELANRLGVDPIELRLRNEAGRGRVERTALVHPQAARVLHRGRPGVRLGPAQPQATLDA